jgi:hypothetical protein
MAYAKTSLQPLHMTRAEHISDETFSFPLHQLAIGACHDARRVLTPVLKHRQRIINIPGDVPSRYHSN